MTAFETFQFTSQALRAIMNVEQQIKLGQVKRESLPAEFLEQLKNKKNLETANLRASAALDEELKQWYK